MKSITHNNPVGTLQERFQPRGMTPVYTDILTEGPSHSPFFKVQVKIMENVAEGSGPTKKGAKFEAAKAMLEILDGVRPKASRREVDKKPNDEVASNAVGQLQELCVAKKFRIPIYTVEEQTGDPHNPTFDMCCSLGSSVKTFGTGSTKQLAKNRAAEEMLKRLNRSETPTRVESSPARSSPESFSDLSDFGKPFKLSPTKSSPERNGPLPWKCSDSDQDVQMRSASARLRTLTSGDSEKISEFFQNLDVAGSKLEELSRIRLSRMIGQTKKLLEEIAVEQEFTVVFVRLNEKTESGLVQSQVQISTMPIFVGLGAGRNRDLAENEAAMSALYYLKSMTEKDE